MPTENLIFICVFILIIWFVVRANINDKEEEKKSIYFNPTNNSQFNNKAELKAISEQLINYTISLGDEIDKNGLSIRAKELMSIINLNIERINHLRAVLGHETASIIINIQGENQSFPVFLMGLYSIIREIEKITRTKFTSI